MTEDNKEFLKEVIQDKYGLPHVGFGMNLSPLKLNPIEPITEWKPGMKRTGLIAKKIGVYPLWMKNGEKTLTTLLQVNRVDFQYAIPLSIYTIINILKFSYHVLFYIFMQVVDNEVVKYIPPEKFFPVIGKKSIQVKRRLGCLIVGAESIDPQLVIKKLHLTPFSSLTYKKLY